MKEKVIYTKWGEIQKSLADVEGMIDITDKRREIENELQDLVTNDKHMKVIISKFEELKNELQADLDEDFAIYKKSITKAAEVEDGQGDEPFW